MEMAKRCRGTPRIANNLLRWVRDFAQVKADNHITVQVACYALEVLAVDDRGLDEMDKRILLCLAQKYDGGPVGLNTLAVAVGEEPGTIEEVYEPFLVLEGFLVRTPRGRMATAMAFKHFNIPLDRKKQRMIESAQGALFP